jgi:signal transduction histidine kinase
VWIPTQDGVAIVDPRRFTAEAADVAATIERIAVDRQPVDVTAGLRLGPQPQSVEIDYTALSFLDPPHLRFRYRLRGLEHDWVDAGSRRNAFYSQLAPGSYTFEVEAAAPGGEWSPSAATFAVEVVPPFWRRWWFVSLAMTVVVAALTLAYRRRMAAMERAHRAQEDFSRQLIALQEQERRRIAQELHDGLGQSLIVMRNWAALGASQLEPDAPGREELDEVARSASRAIGEMREMAQNLAPYALERLGLAETLAEMIDRVQRSSGIAFTHDLQPLNGALTRDVEMTLYRVAQEAVNNVVKHSGATRATLTLTMSGRGVRLTVADNGRGFEPARVTSGMGLSGMAERIRLFNGEYHIHSGDGQGTSVDVEVSGAAHGS